MTSLAIVVDLDNTVFDTAVRKHSILSHLLEEFGVTVSLDEVRKEFDPSCLLSRANSSDVTPEFFFSQLNSINGIQQHQAPVFEGAAEALKNLAKLGCKVFILTTRSEDLREATLKELESAGMVTDISQLLMFSESASNGEPDEEAIFEFKKNKLAEISKDYAILAAIGDRPHDIQSAAALGIFPMLFTSTMSEDEIQKLKDTKISLRTCFSWNDILDALNFKNSGETNIADLRKTLISQYAGWLKDIDEKCRVTVMISTLLVALAGNQLIQEQHSILKWLVAAPLLVALLALIFGIRAYTSRHTSGHRARETIGITPKKAISYLLGVPKHWQYEDEDEIGENEALRQATLSTQSAAHLKFFLSKYKTLDAGAISNLRLYELRASNYSKLYGERAASMLLILGVVLAVIWIFAKLYISQTENDQASRDAKEITLLHSEIKELRETNEVLIKQSAEVRQRYEVTLSGLKAADAELRQKINALNLEHEVSKGHGSK